MIRHVHSRISSEYLQANPGDQLALAGAGEASFERGDYGRAQRYLHAVTTGTDRTKELRTLTDLVIAGDPLAPRLPPAERSRRLVAALSQTIERLDGCRTRDPAAASSAALAPVVEDARTLSTTLGASGGTTAEQIETGFDTVVQGEHLAERVCGPPDALDRALLLIARRHGLDDR